MDFSDPAAVVEVGSYDTYPQGESPNFNGAWGVYPFTQNGMIFVSDIQTGLYVLQFEREGSQILVLPSSIDFGKVEVGTTSGPQTVTVRSFGTENLVVDDILDPGAPFILSGVPTLPVAIPRGGSETFDVTFSPAGAGDLADSIVISSNDSSNPNLAIDLSGRGVVIGQAQAGTLYATSSQLFTIDLATGTATPIGSTGVSEIRDIAIRPSTKEIYGTLPGPLGTTLLRVSSAHGDALPAAIIPLTNVWGIAFNENDTLFAATNSGKLYRIDVTSGDTTFVGATTGLLYSGLSISPTSGELWASVRFQGNIYIVDQNNGSTTLVGSTGFSGGTNCIAFDGLGRLYGVTGLNNVIMIDTTTAAGTLIGPSGFTNIFGLAMRTDSVVVTVSDQPKALRPESFSLAQNYPNPFNPSTQIQFALPKASHVKLEIYNALGERIATLLNETRQAGYYSEQFDAIGLASGIYFYRLQAGDPSAGSGHSFVDTKKLLLLR